MNFGWIWTGKLNKGEDGSRKKENHKSFIITELDINNE